VESVVEASHDAMLHRDVDESSARHCGKLLGFAVDRDDANLASVPVCRDLGARGRQANDPTRIETPTADRLRLELECREAPHRRR
jgi:hypothetical protein